MIYTAQLADLMGVYSTLVQRYLGPTIIIGAAVIAVWFLIKMQFRPMLVSLATAVITAVVLYAAPAVMSQNSTLVKNGAEIVKQIN